MNKSAERALKAYPMKTDAGIFGSYDLNLNKRTIYQQGYEQAEKDLELTWEDIKRIDGLCLRVNWECDLEEKEYYQEVLKRFKDSKK